MLRDGHTDIPLVWRIAESIPARVLLVCGLWLAIFTADATDGRSLAFLTIVGAWTLVTSWGMLTDANGMWQRHKKKQRARGERISKLPLGRAYWEMERSDSEWHRGMSGSVGLLFGLGLIVAGLLAAAGVLELG